MQIFHEVFGPIKIEYILLIDTTQIWTYTPFRWTTIDWIMIGYMLIPVLSEQLGKH